MNPQGETGAFDVVADPAASGGHRVRGVRTDRGDVECDVVVACAGQWTKALAAMAGVGVPLHSAEHFYVVTGQVEGVHRDLPILRDPDGWTYYKEEVGGLVVGGFEPEAKPWVAPEKRPSVISATSSPSPAPLMAPVTASISRIPGPP